MDDETAREIITRFDPILRPRRNEPEELRALVRAGLAYRPEGTRPGFTVLTPSGRRILHTLRRELWAVEK